MIRTVATVVQPGFAPFEFGLACEAFGLDRSGDGIRGFDFRIVAAEPGLVPSNLGFSITVDEAASENNPLLAESPFPRYAEIKAEHVASEQCQYDFEDFLISQGTQTGSDAGARTAT